MLAIEKRNKRRLTAASVLIAALTSISFPLNAQEIEEEVKPETRSCIPTRNIRRIRIIDDRNVLIYMSARRIYQNTLRNTCRGLKRYGTFSYNSSDGQMCEGDGIAGYHGAWEDVRPVPQCWLGTHQRISREQAKALRDSAKRGPKIPPKPLKLPSPEEVGSGTEEAEDTETVPES